MKREAPPIITSTASIAQLSQLWSNTRAKAAIVTDDTGLLVGVVSVWDVVKRAMAASLPPATTPISAVMTSNPVAFTDDEIDRDPFAALKLMASRGFRHVPIIEAGTRRPVALAALLQEVQNHLGPMLQGTPVAATPAKATQTSSWWAPFSSAISSLATALAPMPDDEYEADQEAASMAGSAAKLAARRVAHVVPRGVVMMPPGSTVWATVTAMVKAGATMAVVQMLGQDGLPVLAGIVSETDLAIKCIQAHACATEAAYAEDAAAKYMTPAVKIRGVEGTDTVGATLQAMLAGGFRHVPVLTERGDVVAIADALALVKVLLGPVLSKMLSTGGDAEAHDDSADTADDVGALEQLRPAVALSPVRGAPSITTASTGGGQTSSTHGPAIEEVAVNASTFASLRRMRGALAQAKAALNHGDLASASRKANLLVLRLKPHVDSAEEDVRQLRRAVERAPSAGGTAAPVPAAGAASAAAAGDRVALALALIGSMVESCALLGKARELLATAGATEDVLAVAGDAIAAVTQGQAAWASYRATSQLGQQLDLSIAAAGAIAFRQQGAEVAPVTPGSVSDAAGQSTLLTVPLLPAQFSIMLALTGAGAACVRGLPSDAAFVAEQLEQVAAAAEKLPARATRAAPMTRSEALSAAQIVAEDLHAAAVDVADEACEAVQQAAALPAAPAALISVLSTTLPASLAAPDASHAMACIGQLLPAGAGTLVSDAAVLAAGAARSAHAVGADLPQDALLHQLLATTAGQMPTLASTQLCWEEGELKARTASASVAASAGALTSAAVCAAACTGTPHAAASKTMLAVCAAAAAELPELSAQRAALAVLACALAGSVLSSAASSQVESEQAAAVLSSLAMALAAPTAAAAKQPSELDASSSAAAGMSGDLAELQAMMASYSATA